MPRGTLRLGDRAMGRKETEALLERALVGRLGTVGSDGMPYVTPVNYLYDAAAHRIYFHHSPDQKGHLLTNLRFSDRVCFETDEPGPLIATGEAACNTSMAYRSAICFGRISAVESAEEKRRVMGLFVQKYIDGHMPGRRYSPEMTQLDETVVLAMDIQVMTGKHREAPAG